MATDAEFDRATAAAGKVAFNHLEKALGPGVEIILIATRDRQTASTGTTDPETSRRVLVLSLMQFGAELVAVPKSTKGSN